MFPKQLSNTYYGLRHGESEANMIAKIVSNSTVGTKQYGLTKNGQEEVKNSIKANPLPKDILIYSSDFLRTKDTAKIASNLLQKQKVHYTIKLRERSFGDFENSHNSNYHKVWTFDQKDPSHTQWNVESVDHVRKRLSGLILALEKKHQNKSILLVSHDDPLQILYTLFQDKPGTEHRKHRNLKTAQIIKFN